MNCTKKYPIKNSMMTPINSRPSYHYPQVFKKPAMPAAHLISDGTLSGMGGRRRALITKSFLDFGKANSPNKAKSKKYQRVVGIFWGLIVVPRCVLIGIDDCDDLKHKKAHLCSFEKKLIKADHSRSC
jgi:hypothetical protein